MRNLKITVAAISACQLLLLTDFIPTRLDGDTSDGEVLHIEILKPVEAVLEREIAGHRPGGHIAGSGTLMCSDAAVQGNS